MSTITIDTPGDIESGYPYLVGVLLGVATDGQIDLVLSICREHEHESADIAHAVRILEKRRGDVCSECHGSGGRYIPDPDSWSALERRAPGHIPCVVCNGLGRVPR